MPRSMPATSILQPRKSLFLLYLVVLLDQLAGKRNVLLLSILLGGALQVLPSLPLVLALQVENTGLGGGVVAHSGLFVETVQLQERVVVRTVLEVGNSFGLALDVL